MNFTTVSGHGDAHDVILYSLSTCSHCNEAKKFLQEKDQSFRYINVDEATRDEKQEITKFLISNNLPIAFPVLIIDEKVIQEFKPDEITKLLV